LFISGILSFWVHYDKIVRVDHNRNIAPKYIASLPLGMLDDITEHYGLIESLKTKPLPYWHLEYADKFGYTMIDPPFQKFVSSFLHLFFGQSFAVDGLSFLFITVMTFLLCWQMATYDLKNVVTVRWGLILSVVMISYFFVVLDDREFAVPLCNTIGLLCFFTVCQMYFLVKNRHFLFICSVFFAFVTKYESILFTALLLFFYIIIFKPARKDACRIVKNSIFAILPYLFLVLVVGFLHRDLSIYIESFTLERFMRLDYLGLLKWIYPESASTFPVFSSRAIWIFCKQYILATAFLGIFLFFPMKKDKTVFYVQCVAICYFILVIFSKYKRIHYVSPLVFFSTIIFLRALLTDWATNMQNKLSINRK